jgi:SAM-dependent methyltransferase
MPDVRQPFFLGCLRRPVTAALRRMARQPIVRARSPAVTTAPVQRQPHAVLDLESRRNKALKIERLLGLADRSGPLRLLEVGTGSGGIAHYFATHPSLRCEVDAVDLVDNRLLSDGYRFSLVEGTDLPFADGVFDVVLTNHVIEHVGDEDAQHRHLAEVRRVLRKGGTGYLAVPNRWMLVEPHYKLAFLSWLPRTWRSPYLRAMRKGDFYDCEPLQMKQLERLLDGAGFVHANICIEALRATFEIEHPQSPATKLLRTIPDAAITPFRRIIPTLIYRLA